MVVSSGRTTALDHLEFDHYMNRTSGELQLKESSPNQPTIEEYPQAKSLDLQRNFKAFKHLLIRWIVSCHIAFF